jgi:hypothetical protein
MISPHELYLGVEFSKDASGFKVKHLRHDIVLSQVRQEIIQDPLELCEILKLLPCHDPTYSKIIHVLTRYYRTQHTSIHRPGT